MSERNSQNRYSRVKCASFNRNSVKLRFALLILCVIVLTSWAIHKSLSPRTNKEVTEALPRNSNWTTSTNGSKAEKAMVEKKSFPREKNNDLTKTARNENMDRFLRAAQKTTIEREMKETFVETLVLFDRIWRKGLNLTYFLYGETLLGAARHQGFVPWDDDVDILIEIKDHDILGHAFKNTALKVRKQRYGKSKVFFKDLRPGMRRTWPGWNWPFIDVYGYSLSHDGSMLQDVRYSNFLVDTSLIFPLRFVKFEGESFPVPHCTNKVLQILFNSTDFAETCCTNRYNHRWENLNFDQECVACSSLRIHYSAPRWTRVAPDPKKCEMQYPRNYSVLRLH